MIEIPFVERRWIHRIKKLLHLIDVDLDAMRRLPRSGTVAELADLEIEGHGHSLKQRPVLTEVETSAATQQTHSLSVSAFQHLLLLRLVTFDPATSSHVEVSGQSPLVTKSK